MSDIAARLPVRRGLDEKAAAVCLRDRPYSFGSSRQLVAEATMPHPRVSSSAVRSGMSARSTLHSRSSRAKVAVGGASGILGRMPHDAHKALLYRTFRRSPGRRALAELKATVPVDADITMKVTAQLPRMNLEITHARSPGGNSERISITLEAAPSFEELARFLETGNPFAFWLQAMQLAWLPWLATARLAMLPPGIDVPLRELGSESKAP
jgi:hypothetical protein